MKFEFDSVKSGKNKEKHGIDFVEAQSLWHDPHLLEIPAKTVVDEPRCLVLGTMADRHVWAAVIVFRDDNIRLISVRRATLKEVAVYESPRV